MADRKRLLKLPVEAATLEADGVALAEDRMLRPAIHSMAGQSPIYIYIYIDICIYIIPHDLSAGRSAITSLTIHRPAGRCLYIYIYVVRDDMSDGPATMWTGPKKATKVCH